MTIASRIPYCASLALLLHVVYSHEHGDCSQAISTSDELEQSSYSQIINGSTVPTESEENARMSSPSGIAKNTSSVFWENVTDTEKKRLQKRVSGIVDTLCGMDSVKVNYNASAAFTIEYPVAIYMPALNASVVSDDGLKLLDIMISIPEMAVESIVRGGTDPMECSEGDQIVYDGEWLHSISAKTSDNAAIAWKELKQCVQMEHGHVLLRAECRTRYSEKGNLMCREVKLVWNMISDEKVPFVDHSCLAVVVYVETREGKEIRVARGRGSRIHHQPENAWLLNEEGGVQSAVKHMLSLAKKHNTDVGGDMTARDMELLVGGMETDTRRVVRVVHGNASDGYRVEPRHAYEVSFRQKNQATEEDIYDPDYFAYVYVDATSGNILGMDGVPLELHERKLLLSRMLKDGEIRVFR